MDERVLGGFADQGLDPRGKRIWPRLAQVGPDPWTSYERLGGPRKSAGCTPSLTNWATAAGE